MRAFAPEEDMRLYGRGIRRRLAPMLGGDPRRQAMAYALLLSLPGTPILRYGEEIGMGDDLRRPERLAVRTPMQWSAEPNGGFSDAPVERLVVAPIDDGPFACSRVNVAAQEKAPDSFSRASAACPGCAPSYRRPASAKPAWCPRTSRRCSPFAMTLARHPAA